MNINQYMTIGMVILFIAIIIFNRVVHWYCKLQAKYMKTELEDLFEKYFDEKPIDEAE